MEFLYFFLSTHKHTELHHSKSDKQTKRTHECQTPNNLSHTTPRSLKSERTTNFDQAHWTQL